MRDGPELVQTYEWVGRLNAAVLAKAMNLFVPFPFLSLPSLPPTPPPTNTPRTTLQTALLPLVSLSSASNPDLNATRLSTEEASFLVGTLSQQPRTKKPFVLPGTKIEIFPIGAIITGSWAVLLVGFVGWGTVGKVGFREHYRRRIARDRAAVEKRGRI